MDIRPRRVFLAALAFIIIASILTPATLADSHEYRISAEGSVPIPEQTKKIDESGVEGEFVFTGIKAIGPGEQFTVTVSDIPDRETADLRLEKFVDGENPRIQARSPLYGTNDSETFDAPTTPGLYFLSAFTDNYESLYPLIVEKYNVGVDWETVPSTVDSGSEIDISGRITLATEKGEQNLRSVGIVIATDGAVYNKTIPVEASEDRTFFTYSGTVIVDENLFPPGDNYSVYVVARGPETLEGLRVPVGISDQRTLKVTEPSTPTATSTETPTSSTEVAPSPTETPTASPTLTPPPPTTTETTGGTSDPTTASDTPTDTDSPDTLPTLRPPNGTLQPKNGSTPTDTGSGILTPGGNETESPGGETSTDGQPGFAVAAVVLAIIIAATLLRRR